MEQQQKASEGVRVEKNGRAEEVGQRKTGKEDYDCEKERRGLKKRRVFGKGSYGVDERMISGSLAGFGDRIGRKYWDVLLNSDREEG